MIRLASDLRELLRPKILKYPLIFLRFLSLHFTQLLCDLGSFFINHSTSSHIGLAEDYLSRSRNVDELRHAAELVDDLREDVLDAKARTYNEIEELTNMAQAIEWDPRQFADWTELQTQISGLQSEYRSLQAHADLLDELLRMLSNRLL